MAADREAVRGRTRRRVGPEAVPRTAPPATIPDLHLARDLDLVRAPDPALCPNRLCALNVS